MPVSNTAYAHGIRVGPRSDRDGAAVRHGIARVDCQIDEDLFELAGINSDGPREFIEVGNQLDPGADEAAQHFSQRRNGGVRAKDLRRDDFFATEHQQLPGQRGGLFAGPDNFIRQAGIAPGESRAQNFRVAVDDGQQVIEIVGDAPREPADRLHFLRLPQVGFETAALREVASDRLHARGAFGMHHRPGAHFENNRPGRPRQSDFPRYRGTRVDQFPRDIRGLRRNSSQE